ncbi:MAG: hypothetical protein L0K86_13365 [Actinomycetia bacterium]|nr:hypothetical protein [Actinomycetes bacterium]
MSIRLDGTTALVARLRRMPSHGLGLLASLALVAASLSALMLGTQAASASEPDSTHSSKTENLVGHPATKTRATSVKDRADSPQHRAAPWTPLAIDPVESAIGPQNQSAEKTLAPTSPRVEYDAPTPQGRAPPR